MAGSPKSAYTLYYIARSSNELCIYVHTYITTTVIANKDTLSMNVCIHITIETHLLTNHIKHFYV